MLIRTVLFHGLLTTIFLLTIPNGVQADPITGCVKRSTAVIYNVQIGTSTKYSCHIGDDELTWNQEGPAGINGIDGLDGLDGEPGPPGPAGGPQFILKDSTGAQVGTVITVNNDSRTFIDAGVQVDRRSVLTRVIINGTTPVGLSVDQDQIKFQHRVLYQSSDCTGNGFIHQLIPGAEFGPAFTTGIVVGENGEAGERSLYIPIAEPPADRDFNSVSANGDCISFGLPLNRPTVPVILLDSDLHATFLPGYTLELP